MYVHRSNRMEVLVDELATVLRTPKLDVLAPETILIQSQGMERWLGRELANRLGGFANARFPFPRAFIHEAMDAVLGPNPHAALYERATMTWAVAALFSELREDRAFAAVAGYLRDDEGAVRRLQLAERVAYLFDQYLIYRPKLVLGWEAGRGTDWQALLWRALVERYERLEPLGEARDQRKAHFAARALEFERNFTPLFVERGALPARVCVVGGASLPPLFLRLLAKLAECVEVHLFWLAPTREYMGQAASDEDALAWSGGDVHSLLASLGGVGAAFQQILEGEVSYVDGAGEFVEPAPDSVLHVLQGDLLANRVRDGGARLPRSAGDDSISLVSCHSPMREVEVLRDRLLALFEGDPSLRPDDVVVMAPRIDAYVPLIEAVFSGDPGDPLAIPYRIADRSERSLNPAAEALLRLLGVLRGRLKASEVLDLLQAEPVRRRFGIEATDLPEVYRWVHDAGIRWAEDAAHRAEYGLPAEAANTWRFGLRRLLLGHALADDQRTVFADVVPYDALPNDRVELLGKFTRFCETLFHFRRVLRGPLSVVGWCERLREVIEAFLAEDPRVAWQLRPLHTALHELEASAGLAGFEEPVALEVLAAQLSERLETDSASTEFVAGGVTFCAMLPMRSIPFRVVCLLGMNDGEFPRIEQQLGFDKMLERPQVGDRSQRAEDRYLFLETLLSARDRLVISYVGRGIQDNQPRPPSVVVAELAGAIEQLLVPPQPGEPAYLEPVQHPLQPFSPRAFDGVDPRLASFGAAHALGARALVEGQGQVTPFFPLGGALPAEREPSGSLELQELVAFYQNPARSLLRKLGIHLDEDVRLVEDREPIETDALARYLVGARLMTAPEELLDAYERVELARGALPLGSPGRVLFEGIAAVAARMRHTAARITRHGPAPPRAIVVPFEPSVGAGVGVDAEGRIRELVGVLEGLHWAEDEGSASGAGQVRMVHASYARLSPKHELAAWVRHVAGCAAGVPLLDTLVLGRGDDDGVLVRRFAALPVERARELLTDLVELYLAGLGAPLPFFPALSRTCAERLRKAKAGDDAERIVSALERDLQDPNPWNGAEGADLHVSWVFRGRRPLRETISSGQEGVSLGFTELSRRVYDPLLDGADELAPDAVEGQGP